MTDQEYQAAKAAALQEGALLRVWSKVVGEAHSDQQDVPTGDHWS